MDRQVTSNPSCGRRLAVHLKGVNFAYGKVPVLNNVTLDVENGEFVVIVGKSGSGKTTLLKVIDGLVQASGIVKVQGLVRMVFQDDRLFPWFTARQNIGAGFSYTCKVGDFLCYGGGKTINHPAFKQDRNRRVDQLLGELGMSKLAGRYPNELSGGEKQRVAIARAFAVEPSLVLMDEPFGALDVLTRENMQTWLLEFLDHNKASVVFVTHDVEEGLILADRITVLTNGNLLFPEPVGFQRPRNQSLRYTREFLDARQRIRNYLLRGEV
jgi:NitT/TauT family transport system ATP-binding protein